MFLITNRRFASELCDYDTDFFLCVDSSGIPHHLCLLERQVINAKQFSKLKSNSVDELMQKSKCGDCYVQDIRSTHLTDN